MSEQDAFVIRALLFGIAILLLFGAGRGGTGFKLPHKSVREIMRLRTKGRKS